MKIDGPKFEYTTLIDATECKMINLALQNQKNFFLERDGMLIWFNMANNTIQTVTMTPQK
jgi:hypothetical protein